MKQNATEFLTVMISTDEFISGRVRKTSVISIKSDGLGAVCFWIGSVNFFEAMLHLEKDSKYVLRKYVMGDVKDQCSEDK